jgi:hypothetical protein
VAVSLVDAPALDLREVTEAFRLYEFRRALQLREVLLQHRIGLFRDIPDAERIDGRPKSLNG